MHQRRENTTNHRIQQGENNKQKQQQGRRTLPGHGYSSPKRVEKNKYNKETIAKAR